MRNFAGLGELMKISAQDLLILGEMQRDADQSLAGLSEKLGMAQSTLWRRLNDLVKSGVIARKVAILNPERVGAGLCVLAQITLEDHSEERVTGFSRMVALRPEILECHKISGAADYILKVRVRNARAYDEFYQALISEVNIYNVTALLSMEEIKSTVQLPI